MHASAHLGALLSPQVTLLYRGLRDTTVDAARFIDGGGTERALISTTARCEVAMRYAHSRAPLLLCLRARSLGKGCNISFLSVYPLEEEHLYPPLTYLQPEGKLEVQDGVTVLNVTPIIP